MPHGNPEQHDTADEIESTAQSIQDSLSGLDSDTSKGESTSSDEMFDQIASRLLGSQAISSEDSGIEERIGKAIDATREGQDASEERIRSEFNREIGAAAEQGEQNIQTQMEGRRGFATNTVALNNLVEQTDKRMKDLEQRKQELILQGEQAEAERISQLQTQALEFEQQARQQTFSNLLGLGQLAESRRSSQAREDRLLRSQEFQEENAQLQQLRESGALRGMSDDQIQNLANDTFMPENALRAIAESDPQMDIRSAGDSIVGVNPDTGETEILYTAPSSGSGDSSDKVSIGGQQVSYAAASVINGMQETADMTPTQRQEVKVELNKVGYSSEEAPDWYKQKLKDKFGGNININDDSYSKFINEKWGEHRSEVVLGKKFLDESFIQSSFSESQLEDTADEMDIDVSEVPGQFMQRVEQYREAGFSDKKILEFLQ